MNQSNTSGCLIFNKSCSPGTNLLSTHYSTRHQVDGVGHASEQPWGIACGKPCLRVSLQLRDIGRLTVGDLLLALLQGQPLLSPPLLGDLLVGRLLMSRVGADGRVRLLVDILDLGGRNESN